MTLDELETTLDAMPQRQGVQLTYSIRELRELVQDVRTAIAEVTNRQVKRHLSTADIAERVGRDNSTVRRWLAEGRIRDAYKLPNGAWRVPPVALADSLHDLAIGNGSAGKRGGSGGAGAAENRRGPQRRLRKLTEGRTGTSERPGNGRGRHPNLSKWRRHRHG